MATIDDVRKQLALVRYPGFGRDIVAFGLINNVAFQDDTVRVDVAIPSQKAEIIHALREEISAAICHLPGVARVEVRLVSNTPERSQSTATQTRGTPLPGVQHIVAIASGKGGVGKSTMAVSLALALRQCGLRIGLLDADIHGPSVPLMTGTPESRPSMVDGKKIVPIERFGTKLVSMGFFLDDRSPVIWRGPMVMSIVRQFLKDVVWGELDVLLVDLPPGTGDAQLTLLQEVPITGGVIVTTPQDVALQDVRRGISMFATVQTPVLGVIENMSQYVCPHCGTAEAIFGSDGGRREAEALGVRLLGSIPLVGDLRVSMDQGTPLVVGDPDHHISKTLAGIAQQIMAQLDDITRAADAQ